jgi:hypothetical protein
LCPDASVGGHGKIFDQQEYFTSFCHSYNISSN